MAVKKRLALRSSDQTTKHRKIAPKPVCEPSVRGVLPTVHLHPAAAAPGLGPFLRRREGGLPDNDKKRRQSPFSMAVEKNMVQATAGRFNGG